MTNLQHILLKGLENKLNLVLPEKFEIQKHYISPGERLF